MITASRLRELLHYDPETGVFTWLVATSNRVKVGDIAGDTDGQRYWRIRVDGRSFQASRLAVLYMTGEWPDHEVDHIKAGRAHRGDNRWCNLREATSSQNKSNRARRITSTSEFKGVCWYRPRVCWAATCQLNGVPIHIGYFPTERAAAIAYDMASRCSHGPFAFLNFPPEESGHVLLPRRVLARINRALFGNRIDWLTAMVAQNYMVRMINESVQCAAEAA